jgi:outer membrane lipopolysaccharide assembly protein LptE/RlpB
MIPMRIFLVFLLLTLAGCGYHTPGESAAWVGGDARILYVQLFDNQTSDPYLENYVTDALVEELSRSRFVELTENQALADATLVGEVKEFHSRVLAYGSTDRITDYRATMKIYVRLMRKGSSELLWHENFQLSEDYLATIDKNLQLEGERLAARRVSQRLAEAVHAALLNSF